jgi:multidrug transporter EmrE-like cation transporter
MDSFVFFAVLAAAACHAGWNALLKLDLEPIVATAVVAVASGLVAVPFAVLAGLPNAAAWPWLVGSVVIHIGYYAALAEAYRGGDLGHVYPIARGSAPLLTAVLASLLIGERLGGHGWAGVLLPAFCCWRSAAGGSGSASTPARWASPSSPPSPYRPIPWSTAPARGSPAAPPPTRPGCSC